MYKRWLLLALLAVAAGCSAGEKEPEPVPAPPPVVQEQPKPALPATLPEGVRPRSIGVHFPPRWSAWGAADAVGGWAYEELRPLVGEALTRTAGPAVQADPLQDQYLTEAIAGIYFYNQKYGLKPYQLDEYDQAWVLLDFMPNPIGLTFQGKEYQVGAIYARFGKEQRNDLFLYDAGGDVWLKTSYDGAPERWEAWGKSVLARSPGL